jgi:hypothetical protein
MKPFIGPQVVDGRETQPVVARREYAPLASDYVNARVLAANTSEAYQIPAGARYVNFTGDGNFYAKFANATGTIAVPAADIVDGSAPVLNPGTREIPADATWLILIAAQATVVTLEYWS